MQDVALLDLWLPIVCATAVVWIFSFIFWAASPWHKPDVNPLPDQDGFDGAVAGFDLKPGFYMTPCTHDSKEWKEQAFIDRYNRGPWMTLNVFPGKPSMGKNMVLTVLTFLCVSVLVAYLATLGVRAGAEYMHVFRFVAVAAGLGYIFGGIPNDIWFAKPRRWFVTGVIDAVVYALVTAGFFAWMWPEAAAAIPTP